MKPPGHGCDSLILIAQPQQQLLIVEFDDLDREHGFEAAQPLIGIVLEHGAGEFELADRGIADDDGLR